LFGTILGDGYPAVLHSTGDEENLYVLMPMHLDGRWESTRKHWASL